MYNSSLRLSQRRLELVVDAVLREAARHVQRLELLVRRQAVEVLLRRRRLLGGVNSKGLIRVRISRPAAAIEGVIFQDLWLKFDLTFQNLKPLDTGYVILAIRAFLNSLVRKIITKNHKNSFIKLEQEIVPQRLIPAQFRWT